MMIALDDSTIHMIIYDTHTRIAQYNNNVNTLDKKNACIGTHLKNIKNTKNILLRVTGWIIR